MPRHTDTLIPGQERRAWPVVVVHRVRLWFHGTSSGLMMLGALIGVGAGVGAVVFRGLIVWTTRLFTGYPDYSAHPGAANLHAPGLGRWFVIAVPVIGGLIYGPLIAKFASEARGHGVPEVMLAVEREGGRIRPRVAAVKAVASALCIGSGGSVGREGPIVQIGAALGSTLGQLLRMPESRLRLLVAAGAAGGISATFNAPIAGVFFALELILRDFEVESFGVVVLSSVTANVIGRAAFGSQPFLQLPAFQQRSIAEFGLYAALGLLAALVGTLFVRVLYRFEDVADRIWRGPPWLRPAVGGLLLGGLLLLLPQLYGVGYPVLKNAVGGGYAAWFLLGLLIGKLAATSVTIAIGGSGGVFAPSLFMGAMLGTAYGDLAQRLMPQITGQPGAYGLVGMAAVFAAAGRAPITAVLIIFELTGDYHVILPLMLAVVVATGVATLFGEDSIYTLKLRRRGIELGRRRGSSAHGLSVADAMQAPHPVTCEQGVRHLVARFAATGDPELPVTTRDGAFVGIVSQRDAELAAIDDRLDGLAEDLAVSSPTLTPAQTLDSALGDLVGSRFGLPVISSTGTLVGWLTHTDVLRCFQRDVENPRRMSAARGEGSTAGGSRGG